MQNLSWRQKYVLGLKESLTIKEIMQLRDCGQPKATKIRDKSIKYCIKNNIELGSRKVPTDVVFQVTNLDLSYYYKKMVQENKMFNLSEVENGNIQG